MYSTFLGASRLWNGPVVACSAVYAPFELNRYRSRFGAAVVLLALSGKPHSFLSGRSHTLTAGEMY